MKWFRLGLGALVIGVTGCSVGPNAYFAGKPSTPAWIGVSDYAIPVLMYHRVCPLNEQETQNRLTRDLTVLPKDFEEQVRHLVENGFVILSVYDLQSALLTSGKLPEKAVVLTFDDGYRDNFEHAFPILKKYGASATIFLVSSTVGSPRHLTWEMIRRMRSGGVRYGSHTVTHADLPLLDNSNLDRELCDSKQFLEDGLGERVTSLAYPAGRFDDRVVQHVRSAGYLTAWDKGGGPVTPRHDPLRLPRVRVHGQTTIEDFQRKAWSGYWARRVEAERS